MMPSPARTARQPLANPGVDEQVGAVFGIVADEPLLLDVYRPPARTRPAAGHGPRPRRRDVDRFPCRHG